MLKMYQECLEKKYDKDALLYEDIVLQKNKFKIYTGRCSAHYNMNLDELWTFEYVDEISKWEKYLNPNFNSAIMK